MPKIYLIIHNVRSAHNVGSLLRTADGLGVSKVYLSGYTPYPSSDTDERLPHEAKKVHAQIQKTALGAENSVAWERCSDITKLINKLQSESVKVIALEQTPKSENLVSYKNKSDVAIIVGAERDGLPAETVKLCDDILEIPMDGRKESFNVAVAGGIALFHIRHIA